jgi:hypothetical protein
VIQAGAVHASNEGACVVITAQAGYIRVTSSKQSNQFLANGWQMIALLQLYYSLNSDRLGIIRESSLQGQLPLGATACRSAERTNVCWDIWDTHLPYGLHAHLSVTSVARVANLSQFYCYACAVAPMPMILGAVQRHRGCRVLLLLLDKHSSRTWPLALALGQQWPENHSCC